MSARGSAAPSSTDIAARLDRLPSSRTVWTIVLLISLGCVFEFYDLFFTAYVAPAMTESGLFTQESLGIFASLHAIRVAGFGTFVFSTFAGLGFGVQLVTVDTYIAELMPRTLRGRAFAVNQFVSFCIVPVVALLAWLIVPLKPWGLDGWRWVVLLGSAGALAVWGLRAGIPESPRWLAGRNRGGEADAIVSAIEAKVAAEYGGKLPLPPPPHPQSQSGSRSQPTAAAAEQCAPVTLADIFSARYRGRTIMLS